MIQDDNTQNALLNGEASVAFLYTSQVTQALKDNPDPVSYTHLDVYKRQAPYG